MAPEPEKARPGTRYSPAMARMRSAAVVSMAIILAFALRVLPSYGEVFQAWGVNFQDNDSWSHMRAVHNLEAHYPAQSGFDPYAIYPGGQVHQSEPWDLAIATVAWVMGAGHPSPTQVDQAGAWLPAVLGAFLPLPVFFLGRRLFGTLAGEFSAVIVAAMPGVLLWETHLGVPDHHVAECLLSLTGIVLLCKAADTAGRTRYRPALLAGLVFGTYLCVRPAGIFVPGTLALATLAEPLLAPLVIAVLAFTSLVFLASAGGVWTEQTWLSLAGCMAACGFAWGLGEVWRRKEWPRALQLPAAGAAAGVAAALTAVARPAVFHAAAVNIARYLPSGEFHVEVNSITELMPIWRVNPGGLAAVFQNLGASWIFALPFLIAGIVMAWRARRPALTLFMVWAAVMTAGAALQLRMAVYGAPVIALGAGACGAWLTDRLQGRARLFRIPAAAAFVGLMLATSLPAAIREVQSDAGPTADWIRALHWLERNTPDPMGDPTAWLRFWPRLGANEVFRYPSSAYSVLTWWDYGDWVSGVAHRIPSTNGTQASARLTAEFLTETSPDLARTWLKETGARYVILNPELVTNVFGYMALWAQRDESEFLKTVWVVVPGGKRTRVRIYLPDFYRSMTARLYLFDGHATGNRFRIKVFTTRRERASNGGEYDIVVSERTFPTEEEALRYISVNRGETMTLGSEDPTVSCAELEDLPWIRRVFASGETPLRPNRAPKTVKVFEAAP